MAFSGMAFGGALGIGNLPSFGGATAPSRALEHSEDNIHSPPLYGRYLFYKAA